MPTLIRVTAQPGNTYIVTAAFTDDEGGAVTPNPGLAWQLSDEAGDIINSRTLASGGLTPAPSVKIVLTGLDLAGTGFDDTGWRKILITGTYDSDQGENLPLDQEYLFVIDVLPVPLFMLRLQCDVGPDDESHDPELVSACKAAILHAQRHTNRKFLAASDTLELDAFPGRTGRIELEADLQSVASIEYTDSNGDNQTLATDRYEVKTRPLLGFVRPAYNCTWPSGARDIVITYQAGMPAGTLPKDLERWLLSKTRDFFEFPDSYITGTTLRVLPRNHVDACLDYFVIPGLP